MYKKIFFSVIFLSLTIALYLYLGGYRLLPEINTLQAQQKQLREAISQASEKTQQEPKNAENWALLGKLFMQSVQPEKASAAFKQAVLTSLGNPDYITDYAIALIVANQSQVSDEALKSLKMALALDPKNKRALYFLAMSKSQQGDKAGAQKIWKNLEKTLDKNDPLYLAVKEHIEP